MPSATKKDFLDEKTRAEDIILGSLGYGEEAKIVSIKKNKSGFSGVGKFLDGEEFSFSSEGELEEIELWAVEILINKWKI